MSVTTQVVLGCLDGSHSPLTLQADQVWLSLDYRGNTSGSPRLSKPSTCRLQVKGHGQGIMSLLIFNMTCFTANMLVVHSPMSSGHRYDCDPAAWMAPGAELVMTSNWASVNIEINGVDAPFRLHAQLKLVAERLRERLETRKVTEYLGSCRGGEGDFLLVCLFVCLFVFAKFLPSFEADGHEKPKVNLQT